MVDVTLWHGDCLEEMKRIDDQSIDAIIADPPYGQTACKWDSAIPFEPMWEQLKRIIKPRGAIVLFGSQPFTSALVMSNVEWFKYSAIWEKDKPSNFGCAKYQMLRYTEDILIFGKSPSTYNPIMTDVGRLSNKGGAGKTKEGTAVFASKLPDKPRNSTDRYPRNIIKAHTPKHNSDGTYHPTQKPVTLLEYLIKTYTHEGETVLDFTMGSGTTGVACVNLNRNFIGIEKEPEYFDIAQKRISEAMAAPKQLELIP